MDSFFKLLHEKFTELLAGNAVEFDGSGLGRARRALSELPDAQTLFERSAELLPEFAKVCDAMKLSAIERRALLLIALPAADEDVARCFAALNGAWDRDFATVSLLRRTLTASGETAEHIENLFGSESTLMQYRALIIDGDLLQNSAALLPDARILAALRGSCTFDRELAGVIRHAHSDPEALSLSFDDDLLQRLSEIARAVAAAPDSIVLCIGPPGSGRSAAALAIADQAGRRTLLLEGAQLVGRSDLERLLALALREAALHDAVLLVCDADLFAGEVAGRSALLRTLLLADSMRQSLWYTAEAAFDLGPFSARVLEVEVPWPDSTQRRAYWQAALADLKLPENLNLDQLAARYRYSSAQIRAAAERARREAPEGALSEGTLMRACRAEVGRELSKLARRAPLKFDWDSLVLPAPTEALLRELVNQARYLDLVYHQWGYGAGLSAGPGLCALFSGNSGTGKSQAAAVIARELGQELYRIDLSAVVSKYIGETEKNLDRIFRAASGAPVTLQFDEADALFGKRSEVKDARDRYANIVVAYLLMKLEEFDGLAILTSNLDANIDSAFMRRIQFFVDFPAPTATERRRIWELSFPRNAPLRRDEIDFAFLAESLKLTGANIKNIAFRAAHFAAADGGVVHMDHVIRSVRREYQKEGRTLTGGDLGAYDSAGLEA